MDLSRIVDLVAKGIKRIEELDIEARILRGFRRSMHFDEYSCGMHAVYGILRYYGRNISMRRLENQLRTNGNGTDLANIKRVLRHHGLVCRTNAHGQTAFSILLSLMLVGLVNKSRFQRQVLLAL